MDRVWIRHPQTKATRSVPKEGLPHYFKSGWERTDAPPDPDPFASDPPNEPPPGEAGEKTKAPEPPGLSHVPDPAPSGRRASSKKESDN